MPRSEIHVPLLCKSQGDGVKWCSVTGWHWVFFLRIVFCWCKPYADAPSNIFGVGREVVEMFGARGR